MQRQIETDIETDRQTLEETQKDREREWGVEGKIETGGERKVRPGSILSIPTQHECCRPAFSFLSKLTRTKPKAEQRGRNGMLLCTLVPTVQYTDPFSEQTHEGS